MNLSAYDNLLTLLRNAINGESRVLPSLADWPQLMAQARIHGVEPLAYDAALRLPADQQPDKQLAVQMKQVCLYQMQQQQIWLPRIRKAVEALRSAGVEPVLLKGFGLADLYPKPYLRSWGDADIWVGVSNYHAGCKAVREAFPEAIHHDQEYEELKHYSIVFPDGNPIELHRVSMDFPTPDEPSIAMVFLGLIYSSSSSIPTGRLWKFLPCRTAQAKMGKIASMGLFVLRESR